jgi:hypothetical protein
VAFCNATTSCVITVDKTENSNVHNYSTTQF